MPLYDYRCQKCKAEEERLCSFSTPSEYDCPVCGEAAGMKRQLSVPSISFLGGGWYSDGYGSPRPCQAEKAHDGDGPPKPAEPPLASDPKKENLPAGGGNCADCAYSRQK